MFILAFSWAITNASFDISTALISALGNNFFNAIGIQPLPVPISKILKKGKKHLKDKFIIAFEIGETQKEKILNMASNYYPSATIIAAKDLKKLDRFIFIIQK